MVIQHNCPKAAHPDAHDLGLPVEGARLDEVKVGPTPPLQPPGPAITQQVIMIAAAAVQNNLGCYMATQGRALRNNSSVHRACCLTGEGGLFAMGYRMGCHHKASEQQR